MTIPNYQALMLPVLKQLNDQQPHRFGSIVEIIANQLNLTEEEREALLPAGTQRVFTSRVSWAATYLKKAKLIEGDGRGSYWITEQGIRVLSQNPSHIDNAFLRQFNDFVSFKEANKAPAEPSTPSEAAIPQELDPTEALQTNYTALNDALAGQLLDAIKESSPEFFEELVVQLLIAMGYGGSHQDIKSALTKRSGDEGIDGIIKEDILGFSKIYIQAKRWRDKPVGRPDVQAFYGATPQAGKGIYVTTSRFTAESYEYARAIADRKIILIDGEALVKLMIKHDVGVIPQQTYTIKTINPNFFESYV